MKSINIKRFAAPIFAAALAAALLLCLSSDVFAYDREYTDSETGYQALIDDQADLLTESEEGQLIEIMETIAAEYGNTAFVSVDENNSTASSYAASQYKEYFGYSDGTLFLIDMDNREIYIYSYGNVADVVTDSKADSITDNVYKMASNEDYAGCAQEAFEEIETLLAGGRIAQPMKYIGNALMAILIALIINFIFISISSRAKKRQNVVEGVQPGVFYTRSEPVFLYQTKTYVPKSDGGHGSGGHGGGHGSGGGGHSSGGGHKF